MSAHKILDGPFSLVTESTALVTIATLDEDSLGHGLLTDNYVVGIDVWLVSRATSGDYGGYVKGAIEIVRNGGNIEELGYSLEKAMGGVHPVITVADGDPDVLVQITPDSAIETTHRVWLELRGQDDVPP